MKRGGQLRRSTPAQNDAWRRRAKRIKPVSDKRAAEHDERAEVRERVFRRDGYRCQWWTRVDALGLDGMRPIHEDRQMWEAVKRPCFGELTPHHLLKASAGGAYTEENLTTLCVFHNGAVEDHPALATALGLVIR